MSAGAGVNVDITGAWKEGSNGGRGSGGAGKNLSPPRNERVTYINE